MSDDGAIAERYRLEAAEIRQAAKVIHDERFRDQLLAIATDYETCAGSIEAGLSMRKREQERQAAD